MKAIAVTEASAIGEARRLASALGKEIGMDEEAVGRVAIVVTELATNLVRYGGGGHILYGSSCAGPAVLDILSLDKGPGMEWIDRCLADGFSTSGSAGNGLGAIRRLASAFDVYSRPGLGTAVYAQMAPATGGKPSLQAAGGPVFGGVSVSLQGEEFNGDGWACRLDNGRAQLLVADGLGHGWPAAEASCAAIHVFDRYPIGGGTVTIAEAIHEGLRGTRGAAIAVVDLDFARERLRFCGVGNIAGMVVGAGAGGRQARKMLSHNGTAGHVARKFHEFEYALPPGSLAIFHSDGLVSHWDFGSYPGLAERHLILIAGVLYRDQARGRDDATVVVLRAA